MARDLNDAWSWITRLVRRVERLESGANLESSSITNGRMRFIGGLLRIDSGGRIEVIGEWRFVGPGSITGDVVAEGKWTQNGDWEFNGDGDIAGDVQISGDVEVTGDVNVIGSGRIKAGAITIDPSSNGGSMKFSGGPEVYADGTTLSLYSGAANGGWIDLGPALGKLSGGGARWFEVTPTGFRFVGIPAKTGTGLTPGLPWIDTDGTMYRISS